MSAGQTFHSEVNAFRPLAQDRSRCRSEFCQSCEKLCQAAQRTLKQHTWVSSRLQIHPSLTFNCGIRGEHKEGPSLIIGDGCVSTSSRS
jgi:hypothetical protein